MICVTSYSMRNTIALFELSNGGGNGAHNWGRNSNSKNTLIGRMSTHPVRLKDITLFGLVLNIPVLQREQNTPLSCPPFSAYSLLASNPVVSPHVQNEVRTQSLKIGIN